MYSAFPLFNTACDLAHSLWKPLIKEGDTLIDATMGNGHDTLFLAKLLLGFSQGTLHSFDIQEKAVEKTKLLLESTLPSHEGRVHLHLESHDNMECHVKDPVKLIVYNLGYLPGGDKTITTEVDSTLKSIDMGMRMLDKGGVLSITCYPGHEEGLREEQALSQLFQKWPPDHVSVSHFRLLNRRKAPSLIIVQKAI
ncbi:tRNA (mnm(5)s(2)U34)-methyltransferase [Estrella lausannensis]|uniref:Putative rRNA methylase n=1 Tax=Estrella lausannensis TaxID=483423 RepID=A0A0H5DNY3_9BACT|nr:class I SAM-dependent methyltransferase [Estrella lausannensis]CRX38042.1 putative rRNA methylase [Estrella lausannensis]